MTAAAAIRCTGLSKSYGSGETSVPALRGVDLEAYMGEMLIISGPSGCGKTTLLSIACGTLRPDNGRIELFGQDLGGLGPDELAALRRKDVGFIFQQFNLVPTFRARENVAVPLIIAGMNYGKALRKADDMLAALGLAERTRHFPAQLSGGQQQRVAISRALVHQPRLIICDEPTSSLDAAAGHAAMQILRDSALAKDRCVVVVTHDPRVFGFADRVITMEDGRITQVKSQVASKNGPPPEHTP
jgi:putative ABC transport system ATP-binding protein